MKKFLLAVMNILIVVVPVALLAGGFWLSTGPIWDVLMITGIVAILVYDYKKYEAVRNRHMAVEQARGMVAVIGTLTAFFSLTAQAIFCHLQEAGYLLAEASMVWMFILMVFGIVDALAEEKPRSKALTGAIILSACWISICTLGGLMDFYEYFSGQEIPRRLGEFVGAFSAITAIGAFLLMIVGIIQENRR